MKSRRVWLAALALIAFVAMLAWWRTGDEASQQLRIGLVVPTESKNHLLVDVWRRSAAEQGLPLEVVSDETLLGDWFKQQERFAALILPDTLHRQASPALLSGLNGYVARGGHLLLTFDAATLTPEGGYVPEGARLSRLAGVEYALYESLREGCMVTGPVYASASSSARLGLPPGKAQLDSQTAPAGDFNLSLRTYSYDRLEYPGFVTRGAYSGEVLLQDARGGVAAGIHPHGRGQVIFANLPLGRLKAQTDGWLLHRFLQLLGREAGFPQLLMTADGVGGLVMNVHVDSGFAIKPLEMLKKKGVFKQGPFSIHVTAGPDVNHVGDKMGVNVTGNAQARTLLRELDASGHEIGSHGGWIHNMWGSQVSGSTEGQHTIWLDRNQQALVELLGHPVREYSAPQGNHPSWVTGWLRKHHTLGYYTTANSGAAPTRGFRAGVFEDDNIWSFPVSTLGDIASFEEASIDLLDEKSVVTPWLVALSRFAADQREVRLIYYHPSGAMFYPQALDEWLARTKELITQGRFRWTTIAGYAEFQNRREKVVWRVEHGPEGDHLRAEHPDSLEHMTWRLPASRYLVPKVVSGQAAIRRDGDDWLVVAASVKQLVVDVRRASSSPASTVSRTHSYISSESINL